MEKFLSIPVTSQGNQLVPVTDLKLIEAATVTTSTLIYGSGKVTTITHATVGAASATNSGTQFRRWLQQNATEALATSWTNASYEAIPEYAVSDITIA